MQYQEFYAVHAETGKVLPYASVTVKVSATGALAPIFDLAGSGLPNPLQASSAGLVGFRVADGAYDLQFQLGQYTAPPITNITFFDPGTLLDSASGLVATVQSAADRAAAAANARASIAVALADPLIPVGGSFTAPLSDGRFQAYIKESTSVATPIGDPFTKADEVRKPVQAGKLPGWSDPFFKHVAIGEDFFGRKRWHAATASSNDYSSLSLVPNVGFDGNALRKAYSATLCGPLVWLDEIGATPGDTITIRQMVQGPNSVARLMGRFLDSSLVAVGTQVVGTDVTATSTAQVQTVTVVVPASAAALRLYPSTSTVGSYIDVLALWIYKGASDKGPGWPVFDSDPFLQRAAQDVKSSVDALATKQEQTDADFYSQFRPETKLEYSSLSPVYAATGVSTIARDTPFCGFAGLFTTEPGKTMNMVKVPTIRRAARTYTEAEKWARIRYEFRDAGPAGSVLAIADVKVDPEAHTLNDVEGGWVDPITGDLRPILTDDLAAQYHIAYTAFNAEGGLAVCGDARGTISNFAGQSYYRSRTSGSWVDYTGDPSLAIESYYAADLTIGRKLVPTFDQTAEQPPAAPKAWLPSKVYAVVGLETNIYFDNLIADDARDYYFDVACSVGRQQDDRWTVVPEVATTGTPLTISVNDKRTGIVVVTLSSTLVVAAADANPGAKVVHQVGDSWTASGLLTKPLLDLSASTVMPISLIGTQGTSPNLHEGHGGYRIDDVTTAGRTLYRVDVVGVSALPAINSTVFTSSGSNRLKVQEFELESGTGWFLCTLEAGAAPTGSGLLTKVEGAGDATVTFTSVESVSGDPYWFDGELNFGRYLTEHSFAVPYAVFIGPFGANDVFSATSDAQVASTAETQFGLLDQLIASIHAAGADIHIFVVPAGPPAAQQAAFGANYANGQPRSRVKRNYMLWCAAMEARYKGRESSRIRVAGTGIGIDTVNNYPLGPYVRLNAAHPPVVHHLKLLAALESPPEVGAVYRTSGHLFSVVDYIESPWPTYMPHFLRATLASATENSQFPAVGTLAKVSGTGPASIAWSGYGADSGARLQANGVHPAESGYWQMGAGDYACLKCLPVSGA